MPASADAAGGRGVQPTGRHGERREEQGLESWRVGLVGHAVDRQGKLAAWEVTETMERLGIRVRPSTIHAGVEMAADKANWSSYRLWRYSIGE